jgi:hypothetical protein
VQIAVQAFLERYRNTINNADKFIEQASSLGIGAMDIAYRAAANTDIPIFAIIDEYDHFANNLIAMGEKYVGEVKSGGIVRSFYENLKAGTSSVVKRIFITGITPMILNDLTSGFNMAADYSLLPKYNEMMGFTREEVELLMREIGVDENLIKIDMEAYYNGYMFNSKAQNKVYNSQMILYLLNQVLQLGEQPAQIIDSNLQTDYARLRRLAENESNRKKLLEITRDGGTACNIIEKFSLEKLDCEEYFTSLPFYLGMLTNGWFRAGQLYLT